jgi:hypothetical protein
MTTSPPSSSANVWVGWNDPELFHGYFTATGAQFWKAPHIAAEFLAPSKFETVMYGDQKCFAARQM